MTMTQTQIEALRLTQEAAEERVKLGLQLYKAAEKHTVRQQAMLDQVKADQDRLREEIQQDVARSLHSYDQWMGKLEEDYTSAIKGLEKRIDDLQDKWRLSQQRIDAMMRRSEALLDQSLTIVEKTTEKTEPVSAAAPAVRASTSEPAAGLYQSILHEIKSAEAERR